MGKSTPDNFKINMNINKEAENPVMEVVEQETVLPPAVMREKIQAGDPRRLKSRYKELSRLCKEVPEFKKGLILKVLSTDNNLRIAKVFKPRGKMDRPHSILQFHDSRYMNPILMTVLEGPIYEVDVKHMFQDGLILDDDYVIIAMEPDSLMRARPGLFHSIEKTQVIQLLPLLGTSHNHLVQPDTTPSPYDN